MRPVLNPFWFGRSIGSIWGWIRFNIVLFVIFAAIAERAIPLLFPTSSRLPDFGKGTMLQFIHWFGISWCISILFENSRIMSSKLQYFRISCTIPSGPAALPSVSRSLILQVDGILQAWKVQFYVRIISTDGLDSCVTCFVFFIVVS